MNNNASDINNQAIDTIQDCRYLDLEEIDIVVSVNNIIEPPTIFDSNCKICGCTYKIVKNSLYYPSILDCGHSICIKCMTLLFNDYFYYSKTHSLICKLCNLPLMITLNADEHLYALRPLITLPMYNLEDENEKDAFFMPSEYSHYIKDEIIRIKKYLALSRTTAKTRISNHEVWSFRNRWRDQFKITKDHRKNIKRSRSELNYEEPETPDDRINKTQKTSNQREIFHDICEENLQSIIEEGSSDLSCYETIDDLSCYEVMDETWEIDPIEIHHNIKDECYQEFYTPYHDDILNQPMSLSDQQDLRLFISEVHYVDKRDKSFHIWMDTTYRNRKTSKGYTFSRYGMYCKSKFGKKWREIPIKHLYSIRQREENIRRDKKLEIISRCKKFIYTRYGTIINIGGYYDERIKRLSFCSEDLSRDGCVHCKRAFEKYYILNSGEYTCRTKSVICSLTPICYEHLDELYKNEEFLKNVLTYISIMDDGEESVSVRFQQ